MQTRDLPRGLRARYSNNSAMSAVSFFEPNNKPPLHVVYAVSTQRVELWLDVVAEQLTAVSTSTLSVCDLVAATTAANRLTPRVGLKR